MNSQTLHNETLPRQDLQPAALTELSRTELEDLLTGIANPMLTLTERAAIETELERRGYRAPDPQR